MSSPINRSFRGQARSQVEQDLLLCRAMVALFDDSFLQSQIAMRGGTLLHKVHLAPPSRYSEDIDLVVVGNRPESHVRKALDRVLSGVLGTPKQSVWSDLKLAIRNTVKPSRVLRMTFAIPSLMEPGRNFGGRGGGQCHRAHATSSGGENPV
jgi:hypothetical protein